MKLFNRYFPEFKERTGSWPQVTETKEENIFELSTGGAAMMKPGSNLAYFARKEQSLALGKQLRSHFKMTDYQIFPSGGIQFLHPKDGIFPEKINEGRIFPLENANFLLKKALIQQHKNFQKDPLMNLKLKF